MVRGRTIKLKSMNWIVYIMYSMIDKKSDLKNTGKYVSLVQDQRTLRDTVHHWTLYKLYVVSF